MKRVNRFLIVIIIFLTLIIIGLITLLLLTLLNFKEKDTTNSNYIDTTVNENIISFLNTTTSQSGENYYNILESDISDEAVFSLMIQYLYANNIYKKDNDEYIFKQSDIIKYARMYAMKDNFNYISTNTNFRYDPDKKEFISTLQFGVLGEKAYLLKALNINNNNDTASVVLEIEGSYEFGTRIYEKYNILIDIEGNEYKIISIDKIKE